jgi:hypothetical protein
VALAADVVKREVGVYRNIAASIHAVARHLTRESAFVPFVPVRSNNVDECVFSGVRKMSMFNLHIIPRQAEGGPPAPSTPEKDIEDNTTQLLAAVGSLYGLALLAVLLRVWVRTRILKAFGMTVIAQHVLAKTIGNID